MLVQVVDNSSAFRMHADVPLVIPEVNPEAMTGMKAGKGGIIANPNCSTIIALMAVTPLHRAVGVKRMVVSTYQVIDAQMGGGDPIVQMRSDMCSTPVQSMRLLRQSIATMAGRIAATMHLLGNILAQGTHEALQKCADQHRQASWRYLILVPAPASSLQISCIPTVHS